MLHVSKTNILLRSFIRQILLVLLCINGDEPDLLFLYLHTCKPCLGERSPEGCSISKLLEIHVIGSKTVAECGQMLRNRTFDGVQKGASKLLVCMCRKEIHSFR